MSLPFFFINDVDVSAGFVILKEDTSKHIVQVLRMQNGEQLQLTDGKGNLFTCEITDNNRKRCTVIIKQAVSNQPPAPSIIIAVSLLKNASRFEWFLEKATEIGVTEIIPLLCSRTEKTAFKQERMNGILISAMLQSQQTFLPLLHEPIKFTEAITNASQAQNYIAHCVDENNKEQLAAVLLKSSASQPAGRIVLIGPEGDFTNTEIDLALQSNFIPVSLGETRLRTETAAMVSAVLLKNLGRDPGL